MMTRITYGKLKDGLEVSNLMMTKEGRIIFVEIDINNGIMSIKNIEGDSLFHHAFEDLEKIKRTAREECIKFGVFINEELREKE